jgi:hypothetical protein
MEQTIEKYLRGELSPAEQQQLLNQVAQSPEWAKELALQQQIFRELGDQSKQQFAAQTDALNEDFFLNPSAGPSASGGAAGQTWLLLLGAGVVALAVWLLWPRTPETNTASIPPAPAPDSTQNMAPKSGDTSNISSGQSAGDKSTSQAGAVNKVPETAVFDTKKPETSNTTNVVNENTPEFAPNSVLENIIRRPLETQRYNIRAKGSISPKGKVLVSLKVEWPEKETPEPMMLYICDNQPEIFPNDQFLRQVPLNLAAALATPDGKTAYTMDYEASVNWKPGIYYYYVALSKDGKPIFAGSMKRL